jgi:hypothetical protein
VARRQLAVLLLSGLLISAGPAALCFTKPERKPPPTLTCRGGHAPPEFGESGWLEWKVKYQLFLIRYRVNGMLAALDLPP